MNENNSFLIPYSKELQEQITVFKEEWYQKLKEISEEETPFIDGSGKKIRDKKGNTNQEYIIDEWMRDRLNKYFAGWSFEMAAPLQFLGAEWVVAQGYLIIIDEHLLAFGINPPTRKYYCSDSVRIQYKANMPHTPENLIDVGDSCQSVLTLCLKRGINRLTGIGDDVYGKRIEPEGAGSMTDILTGNNDISIDTKTSVFNEWLGNNGITLSIAYQVLDVQKISQIVDFGKATEKLMLWIQAGKPRNENLVAWKKGGGDSATEQQTIAT